MYNKLTSLRSVHGILQARRLEWVAIPFSRKSEIAQLCLTVCDLLDCSLPGSSLHGILQARVLEWVAISFSRGIFPTYGSNPGLPHCRQMLYRLSHQCVCKLISRVQLSATPWTAANQAPLSTGFSRQEYWSGMPLPSPMTHLLQ